MSGTLWRSPQGEVIEAVGPDRHLAALGWARVDANPNTDPYTSVHDPAADQPRPGRGRRPPEKLPGQIN